MRRISIAVFAFLCVFCPRSPVCAAIEEQAKSKAAFTARINADDARVRSDATVSSDVICTVNKGAFVDVLQESHEWYKIRLPQEAAVYIKKGLLEVLDENTARVARHNVNIRLQPSESSRIVGRANKNEVVQLLADAGPWHKIRATDNSFGWIHRKFAERVEETALKEAPAAAQEKNEFTVKGVIRPKFITHLATHKLIAEDGTVYLLQGAADTLDSLNRRNVKVTGYLDRESSNTPAIEIIKIEVLE